MFDSLQIMYMLKSMCADADIEVLADTDYPTENVTSFKININDFKNSIGNISKISFFTVEPLYTKNGFGIDDDFILRCVVE